MFVCTMFFHVLYKRNKIAFKDVVGESNAVTTDISSWFEITLPTLLSNYNLCDTFNDDEFGLFYQAVPGKTEMDKFLFRRPIFRARKKMGSQNQIARPIETQLET